MIEHYNAFISYKHADRDIKTAEYIERKLEHFHVPRSIRKKTGIRRINHIFRDKDELPITSDLTEQLCYALDHADFKTNFTAALSCLSNIGPGLGSVGPAGSFAFYSAPSKILLAFTMLAGRLELFPMFVLFGFGFYHTKRAKNR